MRIMFWIGIGLFVCGATIVCWTFFRLDKSEDRIRYIRTGVRVLPRAIWRGFPGFLLVWDTEIKLAMMPRGKRLS